MDQSSRTPVQLGAALRRYRKTLRMTQGESGAAINKRQATVSALEFGDGGTLETLLAVLAALELEIVIRPRTKASVADLGDVF